MNLIEEIEKKVGVKVEDLNPLEKETFFKMLEVVEKTQMTPERLKDYIVSMKMAVEQDLTKSNLGTKKDLFLKARLKNYILLEAFLTSHKRAKAQLEDMVSKVK